MLPHVVAQLAHVRVLSRAEMTLEHHPLLSFHLSLFIHLHNLLLLLVAYGMHHQVCLGPVRSGATEEVAGVRLVAPDHVELVGEALKKLHPTLIALPGRADLVFQHLVRFQHPGNGKGHVAHVTHMTFGNSGVAGLQQALVSQREEALDRCLQVSVLLLGQSGMRGYVILKRHTKTQWFNTPYQVILNESLPQAHITLGL